ncbi:MAG: type II CAAX endopeptidase family protein [Natronomonas sp.]
MERSYLRTPSGRLRTPWRLLVATVFFVAVSIAGSIAFLAINGLFFSVEGPFLIVGLGIASGIAVAIGVGVAARWLDHRSLRDLGLAVDIEWWRDLAFGLALGGGSIAMLYLFGSALGVYRPRFAPAAPDGSTVVVGFAVVALFMCLVGFYEELVFRGYFLTNVAEGLADFTNMRRATFGAVALSSLGFALVHGLNPNMSLLGVGTITVAGIALGLGYVLTGRLALPIGFHITWNLAHFVFGLPVSGLDLGVRLFETERVGSALVHGGAVGPEGGVLGLVTTLLGCLVVFLYGRWSSGGAIRSDIATSPASRDTE